MSRQTPSGDKAALIMLGVLPFLAGFVALYVFLAQDRVMVYSFFNNSRVPIFVLGDDAVHRLEPGASALLFWNEFKTGFAVEQRGAGKRFRVGPACLTMKNHRSRYIALQIEDDGRVFVVPLYTRGSAQAEPLPIDGRCCEVPAVWDAEP